MIQMRTKTTSSQSLMKSFDYILKARIEYVSKQAKKQAGKQESKQASKQAGKQEGRKASR